MSDQKLESEFNIRNSSKILAPGFFWKQKQKKNKQEKKK